MPVDEEVAVKIKTFAGVERIRRKETTKKTLEKVFHYCRDCSGLTVMDVGCGYGDYMAEVVRRGGTVYGMDSDIYQLALALVYFKRLGMENNLHLFHHDIQEVFERDELFDIVFCLNVMEHIPKERKALKNIIDLAKVGGKLFFLVPIGMKTVEEDDSKEKEKEELTDNRGYTVFFPRSFVNQSIHENGGVHVRDYKKNEFVEKLKTFPVEVIANDIFSARGERNNIYTIQSVVVKKTQGVL